MPGTTATFSSPSPPPIHPLQTSPLHHPSHATKRLNGLATLCIEKKLLDEIDIDAIVDDFASASFSLTSLWRNELDGGSLSSTVILNFVYSLAKRQ
uniref:Uncharacterized protein n=1 Tax=Oryza rufipogon TaxID=4529 RepID=A0A0E0NE86_ORYRU